MAGLIDKINQDLNSALKSHEETRVSALRMTLSNLKNAQIAKGGELTDEEAIVEIGKDAKRHKESIEAYKGAGRDDLVQKEEAELEILSGYLPAELSDEELANMVDQAVAAIGATSIVDMGRVIKAVMSSGGTRADGAKVAAIVKSKLAPNS